MKTAVNVILKLIGLFVVFWNLFVPLGWQGVMLFAAAILYYFASYSVKSKLPMPILWFLWAAIFGSFLYKAFEVNVGTTLISLAAIFLFIVNPSSLKRMAMGRIVPEVPSPNVSETDKQV
jgi:hypothetical protein